MPVPTALPDAIKLFPPSINGRPSNPTTSISAPCRALVCPILSHAALGSSTLIGTVWFLATDFGLL